MTATPSDAAEPMHEGQDQSRPCTTPTPSARIGRRAPWPKRYAATAAQLLPSLVVANRMLATFGSRQPSESLPRMTQRADQCCQVTYAATYVARSPVTYVAGRPVVTWQHGTCQLNGHMLTRLTWLPRSAQWAHLDCAMLWALRTHSGRGCNPRNIKNTEEPVVIWGVREE